MSQHRGIQSVVFYPETQYEGDLQHFTPQQQSQQAQTETREVRREAGGREGGRPGTIKT